MKPNFYKIFKDRLFEAEEEESEKKDKKEDKDKKVKIETESTLDKVLKKSKKLPAVLSKLMTTQDSYNKKAEKELREVVSDIRCVSYRPTTFRVIIPNSNYFDIIYDPTPLQIDYEEDYNPIELFTISVLGKRYSMGNRSELEQCIDYVNTLLKSNPITKKEEPQEPEAVGGEPIPEEPKAEEPPAEEKEPKK